MHFLHYYANFIRLSLISDGTSVIISRATIFMKQFASYIIVQLENSYLSKI
jgi:hypothetical protein